MDLRVKPYWAQRTFPVNLLTLTLRLAYWDVTCGNCRTRFRSPVRWSPRHPMDNVVLDSGVRCPSCGAFNELANAPA